MTIWIDAQLPPAIAKWIRKEFDFSVKAVRDLGLRDLSDEQIFFAVRKEQAIVIIKDADFPRLLEQKGPPPKVIWLTCGNTSNASLKLILKQTLPKAMDFLKTGDDLIEINDRL